VGHPERVNLKQVVRKLINESIDCLAFLNIVELPESFEEGIQLQ